MAQATFSCPFGAIHLENHRGLGSEERQSSSRLPPDPRYGRRFPGGHTATPARAVQLIASASAPLPLAGQFRESHPAGRGRRAGGDTGPYGKANVLGVGADVSSARIRGPAKQHGKSQTDPKEAKHSFAQSSLLSFLSRKRGPKGGAHATQVLPAGRNHVPKGPAKNGVLVPLPPGRRNFPFAGVSLFVCPKRNQKCPGGWLRGAPALQSPAPRPPLRETLPGSPYRDAGAGGAADCLRFRAAAAGWDVG